MAYILSTSCQWLLVSNLKPWCSICEGNPSPQYLQGFGATFFRFPTNLLFLLPLHWFELSWFCFRIIWWFPLCTYLNWSVWMGLLSSHFISLSSTTSFLSWQFYDYSVIVIRHWFLFLVQGNEAYSCYKSIWIRVSAKSFKFKIWMCICLRLII